MSSNLSSNSLARDVFVGREREMEALQANLKATLAGQGRAVVLLGEPGIGKTRLATELTQYAQVQGMRVLIGRCPDSDGAPPYWPWVQIVRAYVSTCDAQQLRAELGAGAADVAQVIPIIRDCLPDLPQPPRLEPEHERFRFFDSFASFFKNVAQRQPVLLVFDDLQWADAPSLLFLRFLVRELIDAKLLLVITCRDSEAVQLPHLSQTLAAIARTASSQTFRLCGLTLSEVTQFIEFTIGPASSAEVSAAVFQRTEGHPFFMTEVVRLLTTEQGAAIHEPSHTARPVLPSTVRSVIGQRLQSVSTACCRLLTVAAVIGREFRLPVLETVSNLREKYWAASASLEGEGQEGKTANDSSVLALLDEALAARLIVLTPQNVGHYSFTHALFQQTLYEGIPTIERLNLHRWVGETLEGLAGEYVVPFLSELAYHFFQAAQSGAGVDKAVVYATRAAERATSVLAYEEAIIHYERALQLLLFQEPDEERHCDLLLALGKAQQRASEFTKATQHFQQVIELARTRQLSRQFAYAALELAGTRIPVSGPNPAILQVLQEALALLPYDAYALRAQLLARLAKEFTYSDSYEQREQWSYEAVTLARETGDPFVLGVALCDHCIATWRPDTLPERLSMSVAIRTLAEQLHDPELLIFSQFLRIANALEHDNLLTIDTEIASFNRQMAELRPPRYTWPSFHERVPTLRALLTGQFAEAEQQLRSPVALISQHVAKIDKRELLIVERELLILPQFLILRREQGRLHDPELEAILKHAAEQYPAVSALRCALAHVRSELGREAEARSEFEYWAGQNFATVPQRQDRLVTFVYLVELCTTWGDTTRASLLYDLLLPYAERNVILGMALGYLDTVAHLLGKLATLLGRFERAQNHFEYALQRNMRLGTRPRLAHTQYSYARMLLTRNLPGDREQAGALLDQAFATAQELGMPGLVDKVQHLKPKVQSQDAQGAGGRKEEAGSSSPQASSLMSYASSLRREGDYWTITYQDTVLRLKDSRGLHYLSQLLLHPNHEFSALELVNLGAAPLNAASQQRTADLLTGHASVHTGGDAGELLDPQAKTAYQQRLKELQEELEEAREFNDPGRAERLEEEKEFLLQELRSAVGLGGRRRKAGSAVERARLNVTVTLKTIIARIAKQHRTLGQHLAQTIKTGTFCSYTPTPAQAVQWQVE